MKSCVCLSIFITLYTIIVLYLLDPLPDMFSELSGTLSRDVTVMTSLEGDWLTVMTS